MAVAAFVLPQHQFHTHTHTPLENYFLMDITQHNRYDYNDKLIKNCYYINNIQTYISGQIVYWHYNNNTVQLLTPKQNTL